MGDYINIYALTMNREQELIDRFLDAYVDRDVSDERMDKSLMIMPLERTTPSRQYLFEDVHQEKLANNPAYGAQFYEREWEQAPTLAHAIQRGLDYPRRCFSLYMIPKSADFGHIILAFTVDDQLVLGLTLEDTRENEARAISLMEELVTNYNCHLGIVTIEEPPPISEIEFRSNKDKHFVLHRYDWANT